MSDEPKEVAACQCKQVLVETAQIRLTLAKMALAMSGRAVHFDLPRDLGIEIREQSSLLLPAGVVLNDKEH